MKYLKKFENLDNNEDILKIKDIFRDIVEDNNWIEHKWQPGLRDFLGDDVHYYYIEKNDDVLTDNGSLSASLDVYFSKMLRDRKFRIAIHYPKSRSIEIDQKLKDFEKRISYEDCNIDIEKYNSGLQNLLSLLIDIKY